MKKIHKKTAWCQLSRCQKIVLAYDNTAGDDQVSIDSFKKYFLPRVKIENYNIEIDGRNSYDQSIVDLIKQCDKIRKYQQGKVMITQLVVY